MARTIGIGIQSFEKLVTNEYFYVDKTSFIREWWENGDDVTLITRPRRFGKTLSMDMVRCFFSVSYAGREELFEGLSIWREEKFRKLQGSYPVVSLSFSLVKERDYSATVQRICQILTDLYNDARFVLAGELLSEEEKSYFRSVCATMPEVMATIALHRLCKFLYYYYGKRVILLLDEYDTPLQEAYVNGYWEELASFMRSLFNASFKTNPYLERAILTGITRVSKESIFSDLNNLTIITTTSDMYADSFGFTRQEVWAALEEYGLSAKRDEVKEWYDGFSFGAQRGIYNPWSIINYLKSETFSAYWANTSSNSLAGKLIREGSPQTKVIMEDLLKGKALRTQLDEQVVFNELGYRENAVWSLLLAAGYLRVERFAVNEESGKTEYDLVLTNKEVRFLFEHMIEDWFSQLTPAYNAFVKALLRGDIKAMNAYMNEVALATFSFFDVGRNPLGKTEPERFYHGFVLGLLVELTGRYVLTSNRESGFGRYDVVLEPCQKEDDAILLEFKVHDPSEEDTLEDTVKAALAQIKDRRYAADLKQKGIAPERIRAYGFAFEGKTVLIG